LRSPEISILLPVFDTAETLPACLRSIQRQSFGDWECIVVDDGSQDGGIDVARAVAARDSRFRIVSRPHRGLVPSLLDGLERCRGRFVARMDADDWMLPARLACQLAAMESDPSLAGVGCHVRIFPRNNLGTGMRAYEGWLNRIASPQDVHRERFIECPIAHPTLLIRREVLVDYGYRDCGWPEDYDLILRLLGAGQRLGMVPRRLLAWRNHPGRLSRTDSCYGVDRFTACKAEHLAASFLADSELYTLWGYGATGRTLQQALRDHHKRPAWILELHPGRLGNQIAGAAVVRPESWLAAPSHRLLVSVAGETARRQIRNALGLAGLQENVDYVCAA
jgi:glycosyltransferase involved in cell wall biosynthesis